ncbi:MAG: respiratory nitrate reductase subunit gamma [Rhodospirillales bacterium]|nr:respiratory nitrate reductase subunit gamma [Rhodospirillales bacterium]MDE2200406.1 respiratory nitrate reductase subunit gamma [Rhodospirillales bacterium]
MSANLNSILYGWYPYVCLSVFLLGSLVRFDTAQYTWRSGSSQLLRRDQLRWGSNLFHVGILIVVAGHFAGFLMPDWAVDWLISPAQHELLAMVVGGLAGLVAIIGLSLLIHRRLRDPRIRATSRRWDIAIILMLWAQLALGLLTVPVSAQHMDGALFATLVAYIKGIVLLHPGVADLLVGTPLIYRVHILLGFTIFLVSPFTRLVHVWSAPVWYLGRPGYQVVRRRQAAPARRGEPALHDADATTGD